MFVMAVILTTIGCSLFVLSIVYRRLRSDHGSAYCNGNASENVGNVRVLGDIVDNNNLDKDEVNLFQRGFLEPAGTYKKETVKDGDDTTIKDEAREERNPPADKNENGNEGKEWHTPRVSDFIAYLERTYWTKSSSYSFQKQHNCEPTKENLKPILRISKSMRKIHIVYSKNTLWNLAFCDNLQTSQNEQFAFIFKGIKSWSIDETRGRFSDVLRDLFEFRAEIRQELTNSQTTLHGKRPECCKRIAEMNNIVSVTGRINEPKSIVPFSNDPQGHDVVCLSAQLHMANDSKPFDWKVEPPEGLELLIPSVCFVIPSKDTDVPGKACGIELQFKHLLMAWNKGWETKQSLTSSEITSVLKIFQPPPGEHELVEDLVEEETEMLIRTRNEDVVDQSDKDDEIERGIEVMHEPEVEAVVVDDIMPVAAKQEELGKDVYEEGKKEPFDELLFGEDDDIDAQVWDGNYLISEDLIEEDIFMASIKELLYRLENILQVLNSKSHTIGGGYSTNEELQIIKRFQNEVDEELYPLYKQVTSAIPYITSVEVKHNVHLLIERWNVVMYTLRERCHRLIGSDIDSRVTGDLNAFLYTVEEALNSQHGITAVPKDLEEQDKQLLDLQDEFASFNSSLKKLKESIEYIQFSKKNEACRIVTRWERALIQIKARREQLETMIYRVAHFREELLEHTEWLEKIYEKLKADEVVLLTMQNQSTLSNSRMADLLKEYFDDFRMLTRKRRGVQKTFYGAEEFILASKMYEKDLKEYYYFVHDSEDGTCRYLVDKSRNWVANTTLKLSQLYEAVMNELLVRTNVFLTNSSFQTGSLDNDGDNDSNDGGDTTGRCYDYDDIDESAYWEREFDDIMKWVEIKEFDLVNEMPSYQSIVDLNTYVSKLQGIRSDIISKHDKVTSSIDAFYDTLQQCPTRPNDPRRDDMRTKVVLLELRWSKLQWEIEGRNARIITLHEAWHNYDKVCQPFQKWLRKAELQSDALTLQWMSLDTYTQISDVFDASDVNASHLEYIHSLRMRHERFLRDVTLHGEDLHKLNRYGATLISLVKEFQWYITDFPDSLSTGVIGTSQIWNLERSLFEISVRYRTLLHLLALNNKSRDVLAEKHKHYVHLAESCITWISETEGKISVEMQDTANLTQRHVSRKVDAVSRIRHDVHERNSELVAIQMASDELSTLHNYEKMNHAERDPTEGVLWVSVTDSIYNRYQKLCSDIVILEKRLQSLYVSNCRGYEGVEILLERSKLAEKSMADMDAISSDIHILIRQIKVLRTVTSELEVIKYSLDVLPTRAKHENKIENQYDEKESIKSLKIFLIGLHIDLTRRREECVAPCLNNMAAFHQWLSTVLRDLQSNDLLLSADILLVDENITNIKNEMEGHIRVFHILNECARELTSMHIPNQDSSRVSDLPFALDEVNNNWHAASVELLKRRSHVDEVMLHSSVYNGTFQSLFCWLHRMEEHLKRFTTASLNARVLGGQIREQTALLNDAYSHDGTIEMYTDMAETSLYSIYDKYPGAHGNEPSSLELEKIRLIRDRFEHIVSEFECRSVHLKVILTQLEEYTNAYREMTAWLQCSAHAQMACKPIEGALEDTLKHFESCDTYRKELSQVSSQVEHMLKLGLTLVESRQGIGGDVTAMIQENDKIKIRWEVIRMAANKNLELSLCALEKSFRERHQMMTRMLKEKCEEFISHIYGNTRVDMRVETDVDLSDELSEYEVQLRVFYRAADILTRRWNDSDVNISELVSEVDEAWNKLYRVIKNSKFSKDAFSFKDPDEIRKSIHWESQKSDEFESGRMQLINDNALIDDNVITDASCGFPHLVVHTNLQLIPRGRVSRKCSDEMRRLGSRVQFGCHKISYLENYTFLKSTVERHMRTDWSHMCNKACCIALEDLSLSPDASITGATGSQLFCNGETTSQIPCASDGMVTTAEVVVRTPDQKNVSKITTTRVSQAEKLTLRRRYVNEMGEECMEETEIPEGEEESYIQNEKEYLDAGAVIIKSPEENDSTTTEEEFVRDGDGNVTEWIIRKRTRHTKRTRIIRKRAVEQSTEEVLNRNSVDVATCNVAEQGGQTTSTLFHMAPIANVKQGYEIHSTAKVHHVVRKPDPPAFLHNPPPYRYKSEVQRIDVHEAQDSHISHSIPPRYSEKSTSTGDVKGTSMKLTLKCVKGSLQTIDDHMCPNGTIEDHATHTEEGCRETSQIKTAFSQVTDEINGIFDNDTTDAHGYLLKYDHELRAGKGTEVYEQLDGDGECARVENDTDIYNSDSMLTDNVLVDRRGKRVKVMLIVSEKPSKSFGSSCRTKYKISQQNNVLSRNLVPPMTDSSVNSMLPCTNNLDDDIPQSEVHNDVQNGFEIDDKSLRIKTRTRKKSLVKVTVGKHVDDCSYEPSSRHDRSIVIREHRNCFHTSDLDHSESVGLSCDDKWKPTMRILTRNAKKVYVTHSDHCLVSGDISRDGLDHREDSSTSMRQKKSHVYVTMNSKP